MERDITHDRKRAVYFLKSRTKDISSQLLTILGNVYDGVYITDGQANTIMINQAYAVVSGLLPEDVLGKNMREILSVGFINNSGTLLALERRKPVTLEQTFRTGKRALISSTPCFDDAGDISLVITMVRDMSELYGLQEKYRQSEERRQAEIRFSHRNWMGMQRIIAKDPKSQATMDLAEKVAALDTTVLLLGETGVGKEEIAHYICENSQRSDQSFIGINCGAISPNLIESELFGYERGAFTGANKEGKMGIFESADKGTVFLDEIGDLPLEMQVRLLRVLQEMQVKRVGAVRPVSVDVRIIAATNRNLMEMVKNKQFREDLYYRLNVVPIHLLPLRSRKGDIEPLVQHFLSDFNKKYRFEKTFSEDAMQLLHDYSWPGNVRELRNVVEQSVILSNGDEILPTDLPITGLRDAVLPAISAEGFQLKDAMMRYEYKFLCQAYDACGNIRAAAASLGMDDATFARKRKRYAQLLQK